MTIQSSAIAVGINMERGTFLSSFRTNWSQPIEIAYVIGLRLIFSGGDMTVKPVRSLLP